MMNCIQYTAESFGSKEDVKKHLWPKACSGKTPVYFINSPGLDTIVHILDTGHAVQRGGTHTSLVWLDYDNHDGAHISIDHVREALRGYRNIAVVLSSSGSPFKYHIIQELPYEIPMEEIGNECQRLKKLVQRSLPELKTFDERCDLPDQALFGAPSAHKGRTVFPGSVCIKRIVKKHENPMDFQCPDDTALYIPLNSADLAKMRGVTYMEENGYRFDIVVPSMVPKFKKIPEGRRYTWCLGLMMRLMMRCFHLTENCNYPVRKSDFTRTLTYLMFNNIINPDSFYRTDGKCIVGMAERLWDRQEPQSFSNKVFNLSSYFSKQEMPKKAYTSKSHVYEVTKSLVDEWSANGYIYGDTIHLPHRKYLEDIAKVYNTTYTTIARVAKTIGYTLSWKESPVDPFLVRPDGVLVYRRGSVTTGAKMYLKRHGMPYVTMSATDFELACKELPTYKEYSRSNPMCDSFVSNIPSTSVATPHDTSISRNGNTSKNNPQKKSHFSSVLLSPPLPCCMTAQKCDFFEKSGENKPKRAILEREKVKKCSNSPEQKTNKNEQKVSRMAKARMDRVNTISRLIRRGVRLSDKDRMFVSRHKEEFKELLLKTRRRGS